MSDQARRGGRVEISRRRPFGFTLIELLVVISIITLLVGIVVPSLAAARRQSKKTVCLANLRSIGQAMQEYLNEHDDTYPFVARLPSVEEEVAGDAGRQPHVSLPEALASQMKGGAEAFRCPDDRNTEMPETGKRTYFESEETSYEWETLFNGMKVDRDPKTLLWGRMDAAMIWDYEEFHGGSKKKGSLHILFASLEARGDTGSGDRHVLNEE